jgi:hypothetical protein
LVTTTKRPGIGQAIDRGAGERHRISRSR